MALTPDRVLMEGESPHPWERDAMAFIKKALPAGDPYLAALDVELHAQNGAIHQLDAVVLGFHALYVVEVNSHPGKLAGNSADWTFTLPGGRRTTIHNPRRATEYKAKVLASLLQREIPDGARRPWVESLVFLSDEKLEVNLEQSGHASVVTGVLPRFGTGEEAAVASEGGVKLAVGRFDASVRDRLVAFFEKALERDVVRRHESAEEMRTHWVGCFAPDEARGMESFTRDCGYMGEPSNWEERRVHARAELDALFFHLYGIERSDVEFILDPPPPAEMFRVLSGAEMKRYGEYRTMRMVLKQYDRMAA